MVALWVCGTPTTILPCSSYRFWSSHINNQRARFDWEEFDASGLGQHRKMLDRMGRSPLVWQLSSPSPFYSPPSPRRVFSDRVKTLSNCLTRSCSLLRVRQKGQRGPERDDERGRDEGWEGWRRGCQLSWVTLPSEASWPNITGAWQRQIVAIKEQIHTQLTLSVIL